MDLWRNVRRNCLATHKRLMMAKCSFGNFANEHLLNMMKGFFSNGKCKKNNG